MAFQFYSRYVPPVKEIPRDLKGEPPLKKQKKSREGKPKKGQKEKSEIEANDGSLNLHEPSKASSKTVNSSDGKESRLDKKSKSKESRNAEKKSSKKKQIRHGDSNNSNGVNNDDSPTTSKSENQDTDDQRHLAVRSRYEAAKSVSSNSEPTTEQHEEPEVELHGLEPLPQPQQPVVDDQTSASYGLPEWLRDPAIVFTSGVVPFKETPLGSDAVRRLHEKGYDNALAIQAAVLPLLLPGHKMSARDICISASTGSGKTLAYVLPMIEALQHKPVTRLRGLVVVPTRELVAQVRETFETFGGGASIKLGTAVGSKSLRDEQQLLVQKTWRYDPEAHQKEQSIRSREGEDLLNWDFDEILAPKDEMDDLEDYVAEFVSQVDVLICTPGRLVEHIQTTKGFHLHHVKWLVIDEADRLLDESFQQWVELVLPQLEERRPLDEWQERLYNTYRFPRQRKIRKIILSATMTKDISKLMSLKLRHPELIILETQRSIEPELASTGSRSQEELQLPETLEELAVPLQNIEYKPVYLARILDRLLSTDEADTPKRNGESTGTSSKHSRDSDDTSESSSQSSSSDDTDSEQSTKTPSRRSDSLNATELRILVFTNNNENALRLARLLALLRPSQSSNISSLTKSSSSSGRKTLNRFRDGKISILVASDRASRGLDIQDLSHVINYDMPISLTSYAHRVGRTARAGKEGIAMTLVGHHEARWFWNEIARSQAVGRGVSNKVTRSEATSPLEEEERQEFQRVLQVLEEEAKNQDQ